MRFFLIAFFLFISLPIWALDRDTTQVILKNTMDDYIIPSYQRVEGATNDLTDQVVSLCARPNNQTLDAARQAFLQTVHTWSFVEIFLIGPVIEDHRIERFFYFPDRKGRGLRQVQVALANQDENVAKMATLQKMSIALQGLGALEFLLFGQGSEDLATNYDFRCQFINSVSENIKNIAHELSHAWREDKNLRRDWYEPRPDNKLFQTNEEALGEILTTIIYGLESIQKRRLNVFLQDPPKKDRPKLAAFWRSEATMMSLVANLKGLEKLFTASAIETLLLPEKRSLGYTIRDELNQSITLAEKLDGSINDLLRNEDDRQTLKHISRVLRSLTHHLEEEFAPEAGLVVGFSFEDGD
ncbi:MAG: imelysin family protein [Pseudomonadota bacterium]